MMVKPKKRILDFRTHITGLTAASFEVRMHVLSGGSIYCSLVISRLSSCKVLLIHMCQGNCL